MNTIRSTWLGWGTFILCGAGSYYFAKKSVNADRQARHEEDLNRQRLRMIKKEAEASKPPPVERKKRKTLDSMASTGTEALHDPVPTEHVENGGEPHSEIAAKYLPSKPYRSKKGDRLG